MSLEGESFSEAGNEVNLQRKQRDKRGRNVTIRRLLYAKEMTLKGKGWLDFNSLSLTNGSARADSEDNVGRAGTSGSKGESLTMVA